MYPALNALAFSRETSPTQQIAEAADAGFRGIELAVWDDGPLSLTTPEATLEQFVSQAHDRALRITSITTPMYFQRNFGDPDPTVREAAREMTLSLLDTAAALSAEVLVIIPAVVGKQDAPAPLTRYADALEWTFEELYALRHEAEPRGVTIAMENAWNRFLLSPAEAVDLLERVNSPYVGWCVDTGNVLATGYPQDWIELLGHFLVRVHAKDYDLGKPGRAGFCPLGEGSVDWPAVMDALARSRYEGPLIYEGKGNLAEACRRLNNIIGGRPPTAPDARAE